MKLNDSTRFFINTKKRKCNVFIKDYHRKVSIGWKSLLYLITLFSDEKKLKLNEESKIIADKIIDDLYENGILDDKEKTNIQGNIKDKIIICESEYPLEKIEIEITERCNLKCLHCYNWKKIEKGKEIDIENFKEIIRYSKKIGTFLVTLTGGEPFLHTRFDEIINILTDEQMPFTIKTNGWFIDDKIASLLSTSTIINISLSCDGHNEFIHDDFRGVKGSFYKVIQSAEILKKHSIPYEFSPMIHKNNINYVRDMIELFKKYEAPFSFDFIIEAGKAEKNYNDISVSYKEYAEILDNYSFLKNLPIIERFCGVFYNMLYITATLKVKPCPSFDDEYIMGDLNYESLKSVWEKLLTLSEKFKCNDEKNCEFYDFCKGGCRSRAYYISGKMTGKDLVCCELCKKAKKNGALSKSIEF